MSPRDVIQRLRDRVDKNQLRLAGATESRLKRAQARLENQMGKLDSLSPLAVVDRGYSIASKDGKVIRSVKNVKKSDAIEIKVADGVIAASVTDVKG